MLACSHICAYLRQAALDLFEAEWDQLVGMPSKDSTEDDPKVRLRAGMPSTYAPGC